jgi:hypothetical protein
MTCANEFVSIHVNKSLDGLRSQKGNNYALKDVKSLQKSIVDNFLNFSPKIQPSLQILVFPPTFESTSSTIAYVFAAPGLESSTIAAVTFSAFVGCYGFPPTSLS